MIRAIILFLFFTGFILGMGAGISVGAVIFSTSCVAVEDELAAMAEEDELIELETANISYYLENKYSLSTEQSSYLSDVIVEVSRIYNLPPTLLAAIANAESTFRPSAHSNVGARGIMQVMPFWVKNKGFRKATGITSAEQLWSPRLSIHAGAYILSQYIKAGGSIEAGVLAYHGGPKAWISPRQSTVQYLDVVMNNFERI